MTSEELKKTWYKEYRDAHKLSEKDPVDSQKLIDWMAIEGSTRMKEQAPPPRRVVRWFAAEMEKQLVENDHKGGWGASKLAYLSKRLTDERNELSRAIRLKNPESIIKECADVANFALMIADQHGKKFGK